MLESVNITNFLGKWSIDVDTPFGIEKFTLIIEGFGPLKGDGFYITYDGLIGSIEHEKGSVKFNNGILNKNVFQCSVQTEFPIKSNVVITADLISNNKISGTVEIDKYLRTCFIGYK